MTRAETAVFLLRAEHGSVDAPPPPDDGAFSDSAGHWAEAWIEQLAEEDIPARYADGTFRPDASVSRSEMAVLLARTFNLPIP